MKYEFIEGHRQEFSVSRMCAAFQVSRSGFYEWRDRAESQRCRADRALLPAIHRVHMANREAYGAKKTWLSLNQSALPAANTVLRGCANKRGSKPGASDASES